MAEAYFREHAPQGLVADLESLIASATPPRSFTPTADAKPAHRGKAVANANARGFASLMGQVPRGGRA